MKKFSKSEVYEKTLFYFEGDDLATDAWINKYALKDTEDNLLELTPDDMHKRLAKELSRIEQKYKNPLLEEEVYNLIKDFKYLIPQGSPMKGIGNNFQIGSLSNCFVLESPYDSYAGIFKTEQEMVQLMKRRGGVGMALSSLRAKHMKTSSLSEKSSGIVLFGERYSNGAREVAQDGRRGALMLSLMIQHPDVEYFIDAKLDDKKITGANISVMITEEFMKAVLNEEEFETKFVGDTGEFTKKIDAKKLWDKIIYNAWKSAEPGILFWDNILKESPARGYGEEWKEKSTNPCGEIPLCPYDSCRLLAINLYSYVDQPFTKNASFNWQKFKKHVKEAQKIMDDIVDLEVEKIDIILNKIKNDPDPDDINNIEFNLWIKIREKALQGRRTGLGITAEGDMLAALGLKYASEEAIEFSTKVHKTLAIEAYKQSIILAKERGCFPIWEESKDFESPFVLRVISELPDEFLKMFDTYGRRNIGLLTIAPTGTTSLMTQTTSGIEPLFLPFYKRRRKISNLDVDVKVDYIDKKGDKWQEYTVFHKKFIKWYQNSQFNLNSDSFQDCENYLKTLDKDNLDIIFKNSPYYQATSNDVDWVAKVKMQGQIQKWIDHSISCTTNVPNETSPEVIGDIYMEGWKSGIKGLTVYRDGSRSGILVTDKKDNNFKYEPYVPRPEKILKADIHHLSSLKKRWMVVIGLYQNKPYEVFAIEELDNEIFPKDIEKGEVVRKSKGKYELVANKKGQDYNIMITDFMPSDEAFDTRMFSLILRSRTHPKEIVKSINKQNGSTTSFQKAISRVLKGYVPDTEKMDGEICPRCGGDLIFKEGCVGCNNCDYSVC
jgi:ribonucleoside-diphosphate reductase alpha chain